VLRYLQQVLFTTLFAILASQASAMFIQPDWLDPTEPGVGTNRYSYSANDPINKLDPNGNFFDEAEAARLARTAATAGARLGLNTLGAAVTGFMAGLGIGPAGVGTFDPNMSLGRADIDLSPEDRAAGYYQDHMGNLIHNGTVVDPSELPSQRAYGATPIGEGAGLPTSQGDFDQQRQEFGSQSERDAYTGRTLAGIAEEQGWKYDGKATRRNGGRRTFRTPDGEYRAIDKTHGQYEAYDSKGNHLGQESIDGELNEKKQENQYSF